MSSVTSRAGTAPGPTGLPVVGSVFEWRKNPTQATLRWFRDYGDVVRARLGPERVHLVAHPDHVKHVLQENAKNYSKQTRGFHVLKRFLGEGLLTSDGPFWLRQRRIAQPVFHKKRINALGERMTGAALAMLEHWDEAARAGQTLEVHEEMMRLALRIVGETLLSTDVSGKESDVGGAITWLLHDAVRRITSLWTAPDALPTSANRRSQAAAATLDRVVIGMIQARRASDSPPDDLLTTLMEAQDEETGERMSDRQLRDEVMTMFLAGHETTANALTWTFCLLAQYPPVARRLHAELDSVLGGRTPEVADLARLPFTALVIQESMRLYPPAWLIPRQSLAADEIGGYPIPADTIVFTSPWVTHRHPAFWPDPEGFDPDRFGPEQGEKRHKFAYFPFGGGPRQCIGNHFAMIEAQLVLATVAQRFRLELVPGQRVDPEPVITLRPRYGMRMHPVARSAAARAAVAVEHGEAQL